MNHLQQLLSYVQQETRRQQKTISLIASENYAPVAIRKLVGSELMNKYAEGTPGNRYYSGCTIIDEIEKATYTACCELFGGEYANVQPHSGSQANQAVFLAALKPGDKILGMNLSSGGHLSHGYGKNFSGIFYHATSYELDPTTNLIDFSQLEDLIKKERPKLVIAGASAYSRQIDFKTFAEIAHRYGALLLADIAHIGGLVATGLHPSPLPHADFVTGTTHKTLRGPRGGFILTSKEWGKKIDRALMPGIQGGPHLNSIAAKGACFALAAEPSFIQYQQQIIRNAQTLVQELQHYGFSCLTGGTDNHLLILDTYQHKITGKTAEERLEEIGITSSRSAIPGERLSPSIGSGLRLGTPAVTTRDMKEGEMKKIAQIIFSALLEQQANKTQLQDKVKTLTQCFPIPE